MSDNTPISRRQFIKISGAAGAGLIIAFYLGGCEPAPTPTPPPTLAPTLPPPTPAPAPTATLAPEPSFVPNAYLQIDHNGKVTITIHRSEMGQGVMTAIPMIVADELGADWNQISTVPAPADSKYGDQVTGGSVSISSSYETLRRAGAIARDMLLTAAAQTWGYAKETLWAENGVVVHRPSQKQLRFGELVEAASKLSVPNQVQLKDPKDFKFIGTRVTRQASLEMVTGRASYGLDVRLPGMLYAAVARCPIFGGDLDSFDDGAAKALPGVRGVYKITSGVAVVAETSWQAIKARDALKVQWTPGKSGALDSDSIRQQCLDLIEKAKGNYKDAKGKAYEALYEVPYLAHATMEPMNATAEVRADRCEVWAPTQDRQQARSAAQSFSQLEGNAVQIHVPLIGTGCGRRLMTDYVGEAVQLSKAAQAPVQVVWTRQDDIQHDYYRPASYHWLRAGLDDQGKVISWIQVIASQGIYSSSDITAGAIGIPYRFDEFNVNAVSPKLPIPTGYWRSVANSQNAFVNESFIDELAALTRQDPFQFRSSLMGKREPLRDVLTLAAEKAGWGKPLARSGHFLGMACHSTWGVTPVAQVAEVSVSSAGQVQVHRVVCAVDCGVAVSPDLIEAQMEGGIVFGLTGLLKGQITFKNGRVEQAGLTDFPLPTIQDAPQVEVHILPSTLSPTGIGEMAGPVIVPAVANAVFAATGKRIRRLPIRPEDCKA